ncbi:aspartic peptidase domain-containing protein [Dichotomocladium elegans]|nr:aspartic peptidase domain-containing protein [Dichotomocladium elegans]
MKTFLYCLAAITLFRAGFADAAILDDTDSNSFNIKLAQKQGPVLNTPARILKALNKYNLTSRINADTLIKASSTVDLSSVNVDVEYVGTVGIGTPPKMFQMDFDTGSSDIWVPHVSCERCSQHARFDDTKSSTYSRVSNATWSLRYGDGSGVTGKVGKDTIHLGSDLSYANQTIGLATAESIDFVTDTELDGLFGLGFPSLAVIDKKQSIVQGMKEQNLIDQAIVGVYLGRARDGGSGQITFGKTDPAHYQGELKYVPVTSERYWQVELNSMKIAGVEALKGPIGAIVDTGTTLIVLPTELSKAIHAAIPGARFSTTYGWRMPCELRSTNKVNGGTDDMTVAFSLGEHEFHVKMSDLIRERAAPNAAGDKTEKLCYSGIAEARTPFIILGDTFLRSYYSVYDFDRKAVGLAPAKP